MLLELAKKFNKLDDSLGLFISTDGVLFTIEVRSSLVDGGFYSFTSTDIVEVVDRVENFYKSLLDCDRFDKLLDEVSNEPLEALTNG